MKIEKDMGEYMKKEFDEVNKQGKSFGMCEDCGVAKATNRSASYPDKAKYRCTDCWIKSMG